MGEPVVFFVEKLGNLLSKEAKFLHGVSEQFESLKSELRRMKCFLTDAEAKRRTGAQRMQNWVREVRDVAYQVENVVDTVTHMIEKRRSRSGGLIATISRYAHIPEELIFIHKLGKEILRIKNKIREISDSRSTFDIPNIGESGDEGIGTVDVNDTLRRRHFPSLDDYSNLVGVEDEQESLKGRLRDLNNARLCVISIVGMGGVGKTTLAARIYNDPVIKGDFPILVWLFIPRYDTIRGLLEGILAQLPVDRTDLPEEEHVCNEIGKKEGSDEEHVREKINVILKKKRYLIVLDDVWKDDLWPRITNVFPNENNGSRVLLTTRYTNVAKSADPSIHPHKIRLLNYGESWELFCKKAFACNVDGQTRCPQELKDLSWQLAMRCGGLPLALVVLGGLLSSKDQTYDEWLKVANSLSWDFTADEKRCIEILALSYNDLPNYNLKLCFIFICSFPKGTFISASTLIRLWIAEGFIQQRQKQPLEETARDYLKELVQRCMVQVVERSWADGWIKQIHVHDVLCDMGIKKAREDGILDVLDSHADCYPSPSNAMPARCVAVHNMVTNDDFSSYLSDRHTLLVFNKSWAVDLYRSRIKLKSFRAIHLEFDCQTLRLPKATKSMVHLRYLKIGDPSKFLSTNICNLITLDVSCYDQIAIPDKIWKIRTLRHIYFRGSPIEPTATFSLSNLQVLWNVRAGKWIGTSLANHTHLQKLKICGISISHHWELITSLQKLELLVSLRLQSSESIPTESIRVFCNQTYLRVLKLYGKLSEMQQLPQSNEFPPQLTKLLLSNSQLEYDPMPTLEKLPNLVYLSLDGAYIGESMSCSVGGFSRLQHLTLKSLDYLEDWRVVGGAMPSLTQLTIHECNCLKMLPEGLQQATSLKELRILQMPGKFMSRLDPIGGDDLFKIEHVPFIETKERDEDPMACAIM